MLHLEGNFTATLPQNSFSGPEMLCVLSARRKGQALFGRGLHLIHALQGCFLPHHRVGFHVGRLFELPSSHQLRLTYDRSEIKSETINSCKVMYYLTGN